LEESFSLRSCPLRPRRTFAGLEVCTAEKQMERRTGCLQSNIDFLQQSLAKLARETQEKITAPPTAILPQARAEIVTLKSAVAKLDGRTGPAEGQARSEHQEVAASRAVTWCNPISM
jgi:hypothetical protein